MKCLYFVIHIENLNGTEKRRSKKTKIMKIQRKTKRSNKRQKKTRKKK